MYTLSIILNLHREGELAAKTIQNLRNIIDTPNDWEDVEVIVVLDNADELTSTIVKDNKDFFVLVEEVKYRDPADSRNHGVNCANNEFILFADGDDYSSHNILQSLYEIFLEHYNKYNLFNNLLDEEHIAIFPEYLIEFPSLLKVQYCNSNTLVVRNNRFSHCYISRISTHKSLLEKYKSRKSLPPYGYEDWDLNVRLLDAGVQYKVAPYKLYYRKENANTVYTKHVNQKSIIQNSSAYSNNYLIKETQISNENTCVVSKFLSYTPKSVTVNEVYKDILFEEEKLFLQNYNEHYTYKEDALTWSTAYYSNTITAQSRIYEVLMNFFKNKQIIYFVPWIELGGADKVVVEHTDAIKSNFEAGLITTLTDGPRVDRLKIPHLDLHKISSEWKNISQEDRLHILIRAIINSKIKTVHIINSDIALQTVKYYGSIYDEFDINLIVTFFGPAYDWNSKTYVGYPVMYPEAFKYSKMIISDNVSWYDFFKKLNSDIDFPFIKIPTPVESMPAISNLKEDCTKKILWASRICDEKLVNVLKEIVLKLPDYYFVMYGNEPSDEKNKQILQELQEKENVEFRGAYHDIVSLDVSEFDLFLYTSMFDGLPNVILEMAMKTIPIVSANVGGITEVLGKDYPLLVTEQENPDAYINKIEEFYTKKDTIIPIMTKIRKYIIEHHNKKIFQKEYLKVVDRLI